MLLTPSLGLRKTALRGGGWGQGEDLRGRSPVNISGLEKIPSFNCFSGTCMALDGHVSLASETHFPVAQTGDSIFFFPLSQSITANNHLCEHKLSR